MAGGITIVGYSADADVWCPECAKHTYADQPLNESGDLSEEAFDHEGNPIHPIFSTDSPEVDECCNKCGELVNRGLYRDQDDYDQRAIDAMRGNP